MLLTVVEYAKLHHKKPGTVYMSVYLKRIPTHIRYSPHKRIYLEHDAKPYHRSVSPKLQRELYDLIHLIESPKQHRPKTGPQGKLPGVG